jgi:hypothetical protein
MSKSNKTKEPKKLKAKKATSKKAKKTSPAKTKNAVEKSCKKLAKKLKKKKVVKVLIAYKNNSQSKLRVSKFAWGLPKPGSKKIVLTIQNKKKNGKWETREIERQLSAIKSLRLK